MPVSYSVKLFGCPDWDTQHTAANQRPQIRNSMQHHVAKFLGLAHKLVPGNIGCSMQSRVHVFDGFGSR